MDTETINKISNNFSKSAKSYHQAAATQKYSAHKLSKILYEYIDFLLENDKEYQNKLYNPKNILDLGSGTGYMIDELLTKYPDATYVMNDISKEMIHLATKKFQNHQNFQFLLSNMEYIKKIKYSIISSNFSLQWISNLEKMLEKITKQSEFSAFTILGDETFIEWKELLSKYDLSNYINSESVASFVNESELLNILEKISPKSFTFDRLKLNLEFQNPYEFMRYLKTIGANTMHSIAPLDKITYLLKNEKNPLIVSYDVIFVVTFNGFYDEKK